MITSTLSSAVRSALLPGRPFGVMSSVLRGGACVARTDRPVGVRLSRTSSL